VGKILAEYQSHSNPGKHYTIMEAQNGEIYCDCWTWKRTRGCAHLSDYKRNHIVPPQHSTLEKAFGTLKHEQMDQDGQPLRDPIQEAITKAVQLIQGG
jgi:hypothetical protein